MGDLLIPPRVSSHQCAPTAAAATVARRAGIHPETVRRHRRKGTQITVERPAWRVYLPEVLVDAGHPEHPDYMTTSLRATVLGVCLWANAERITPEGSWWHVYASKAVGMATSTFRRHLARLGRLGAVSCESGRIRVTPPMVEVDSPEQLRLSLTDDHRLRTDSRRSGALGAQCRWHRGTTHPTSHIRKDSTERDHKNSSCAPAHFLRERRVQTSERPLLETLMAWDRWRGPPAEVVWRWARACGWAAAEEAALTLDHRIATGRVKPLRPWTYGRALAERFRNVDSRMYAKGRRRDEDEVAGRYRAARREWWSKPKALERAT